MLRPRGRWPDHVAAISIPAGFSSSGLPIGLQAYARRHEDALLLDLAPALERA